MRWLLVVLTVLGVATTTPAGAVEVADEPPAVPAFEIAGLVTLGRHKLQQRGGRLLQIVSGGLMLALGTLLLLRPAWLRFA